MIGQKESMVTGIIYDDKYKLHLTGFHNESPERLEAIMDLVNKKEMLETDDFILLSPRIGTVDDVKLVHEKRMIERAKIESGLARNGNLRYLDLGDTVVCEDSFEVALLAVGGVLTAADAVIEGKIHNAFAIVRPPGHHAKTHSSSGFCIFNNMAILAEYLVKKGFKKVAIFDIDLHHGNGTSQIFYDRKDILFFSSHQDGRTKYPGSGFINEIGSGDGKGYNINVPFVPESGDDAAQKMFENIVKPIFEQFEPDFILGSIGCDAHYSDPLGELNFTTHGYGNYVKGFKDLAEKLCDGKLILTLEGGYSVRYLAQSIVNILYVLADKEMPFK
ncbi:MAG: histone deacetylase, partial [Candidatus Hodarchaeota archaeon]